MADRNEIYTEFSATVCSETDALRLKLWTILCNNEWEDSTTIYYAGSYTDITIDFNYICYNEDALAIIDIIKEFGPYVILPARVVIRHPDGDTEFMIGDPSMVLAQRQAQAENDIRSLLQLLPGDRRLRVLRDELERAERVKRY